MSWPPIGPGLARPMKFSRSPHESAPELLRGPGQGEPLPSWARSACWCGSSLARPEARARRRRPGMALYNTCVFAPRLPKGRLSALSERSLT